MDWIDFLVPAVWTLVVNLVGIVTGYYINHHIEKERREYEKLGEYPKEIRKRMDDLIKPLFGLIGDTIGALGRVYEYATKDTFEVLFADAQSMNAALHDFVQRNYTELALLLPRPFPWFFFPLFEHIQYKVLDPLAQGEKPSEDHTTAVNQLQRIQEDLRELAGFAIDVEMKTTYPFTSKAP